MMISKATATDIALAYREIEVAEQLLADVTAQESNRPFEADIRDLFGRRVGGLELGVPTGSNSKRLFTVEWQLASPVIRAHIAAQKERLAALMVLAAKELAGTAIDADEAAP